LIRRESDAWLEEQEAFAPAQWDAPTNCPPWEVRTVIAHVCRGAISYLDSLDAARKREPRPYATPEQRAAAIAQIAAQTPDRLAAEFRRHVDDFERAYSLITERELELRLVHPFGQMSPRWFAEQRLAEIAYHRWDIGHSLGHDAEIDAEVCQALLPMLLLENAPAISRLGGGPKVDASYTFVDETSGEAWTLDATGGRLTARHGIGGDTTVSGDPSALVLLVYGRRPLDELIAAGRIHIEGADRDGKLLGQLVKGP
jgi:uncharacterized protein (TIGR03083 family)